MSDVVSAVAGTVADLFGEPAAAEETPNSPTDAAAPEAHEAALPIVPAIPEDLIEFLDEPDFDDDPVALTEDDEFVDPDQLARENAKLRKQVQYAEQEKAKAQRAKWSEEASKYFPFADLSQINSTSRRGFLRDARASHEAVAKQVSPLLADIEAVKAAAREQAYAEAKAAAAEQWGRPNVAGGPSGAPLEAVQAADELDRARNSRNLSAIAKALMNSNQI